MNAMQKQSFQRNGEAVWRKFITALAWLSWLAALAVFAYATWQFDPSKGEFAPQWVGFTFITCIGVGIAAGNAKAKHNLSDTILAAFETGMIAQAERTKEISDSITAADHAAQSRYEEA